MKTGKLQLKKIDYSTKYRNGNPVGAVMHLFCRNEQGERVHLRNDEVDPYFYLPEEEVTNDVTSDRKCTDVDWEHQTIYGDDVARVYTRIPGDVPKLRKEKEHYEADILFPNRFLIDTDFPRSFRTEVTEDEDGNFWFNLDDVEEVDFRADTRICYCDIEVHDKGAFPDAGDAEKKVVSISYYDTFDEEYVGLLYHEEVEQIQHDEARIEVFDTEEELLETFSNYLCDKSPDVLAGWNFKEFDARYLINRMDNLEDLDSSYLSPINSAYDDRGFAGKIRGIAVFDLLRGYKNLQFSELDSYSLEDVAQEELGTGKIKDTRKIHEQWNQDPKKLIEYNVKDVKLTVDLDDKQNIISFYEVVANLVNGRLSEVVDFSKADDIYILHQVNGEFVVPSKSTVKSGEEFEGGQVFDPITGIKQNVVVLDLKSLYPMSMKTINAGPRTKDHDGDIKAPDGTRFTSEKESIVTELIDEFLEEREEYKSLRGEYEPGTEEYRVYDQRQRAVKILMNTLYGIMGWNKFRLYDPEVGSAVTAVGRECIKFTEEVVERMGYTVTYGDTDSVMLELNTTESFGNIISTGYELEEEINKAYDEFAKNELNVDEHFLQIEFEKLYKRYFQAGKKKRYAGHIVWKEGKNVDDIDVVGFETERSDYGKVPRRIQEETIEMIVRGAGFDEVGEYIRTEIQKIRDEEYEMDMLGKPTSIGQAFDKYDSKTMTVKGAEYSNEYLGAQIQPGDKPKGMYIKKTIGTDDDGNEYPMPDMPTPFICWMNQEILPDTFIWDFDQYIEKQIENPLSRIFKGTDWTFSELINNQRQQGVTDFVCEENGHDDPLLDEDIDFGDEDGIEQVGIEEDDANQKTYTQDDPTEGQLEEQTANMELGDDGGGDPFGEDVEFESDDEDDQDENEEQYFDNSFREEQNDESQVSLTDF